MQKRKILLAAILVAPLFVVTSCNSNTISVTLDTGAGFFLNGDCYRTIEIAKGSNLGSALADDLPIADISMEEDNLQNKPIYWIDDNDHIINWDTAINSSTTLHAHYYCSINEAREFGLQKIGSAFMTAISKQPEIVQTLSIAYQIAVNHIVRAPSEGSALAMGKIGSAIMSAASKQPRVTEEIYNNAEFYYVVLETDTSISNINAIGLGEIASKAMDSIARQPDSYLDFDIASKAFIETINSLPIYSGHGFAKFGGTYMEACARQPGIMTTLLEKTPTIFKGFKSATSSLQSLAIGNVAGAWADACAHEISCITDLTIELYRCIEDILKN